MLVKKPQDAGAEPWKLLDRLRSIIESEGSISADVWNSAVVAETRPAATMEPLEMCQEIEPVSAAFGSHQPPLLCVRAAGHDGSHSTIDYDYLR